MGGSRRFDWARESMVRRWEHLLETIERAIPEGFVPMSDEALVAGGRRRPPELVITVTQRGRSPEGYSDGQVSGPLSEVTIAIRPESPRSQAARERQWTELCRMRDSLRARIERLRHGGLNAEQSRTRAAEPEWPGEADWPLLRAMPDGFAGPER